MVDMVGVVQKFSYTDVFLHRSQMFFYTDVFLHRCFFTQKKGVQAHNARGCVMYSALGADEGAAADVGQAAPVSSLASAADILGGLHLGGGHVATLRQRIEESKRAIGAAENEIVQIDSVCSQAFAQTARGYASQLMYMSAYNKLSAERGVAVDDVYARSQFPRFCVYTPSGVAEKVLPSATDVRSYVWCMGGEGGVCFTQAESAPSFFQYDDAEGLPHGRSITAPPRATFKSTSHGLYAIFGVDGKRKMVYTAWLGGFTQTTDVPDTIFHPGTSSGRLYTAVGRSVYHELGPDSREEVVGIRDPIVKLATNGPFLVIVGQRGLVNLYNTETRGFVFEGEHHVHVNQVAVSDTGRVVLACGKNKDVVVLDRDGKEQKRYTLDKGVDVFQLVSGPLVVVLTNGGTMLQVTLERLVEIVASHARLPSFHNGHLYYIATDGAPASYKAGKITQAAFMPGQPM